jgi:hypothetical protein
MDPIKPSVLTGIGTDPTGKTAVTTPVVGSGNGTQAVALPPEIQSFYLPIRGTTPVGSKLLYKPGILGAAKINYSDAKTRIEQSESGVFLAPITDNAIPVVWEDAQEIKIPAKDLERSPQNGALYAALPPSAIQSKNYQVWNREFSNWLYGTRKLELMYSPSLKEVSRSGETDQEFRIRLSQVAREHRDEAVDALRKKYSSKMVILQDRKRRAQQTREKQVEQAKKAKLDTAISFGSTLLSAFTGRKLSSTTISRASTAMKGVTRSMDESKDVDRAGETVEAIDKQIADLQAQFDAEIQTLDEKTNPTMEQLDSIVIKPGKSDFFVQLLTLVWVPYWQDTSGILTPAFQ